MNEIYNWVLTECVDQNFKVEETGLLFKSKNGEVWQNLSDADVVVDMANEGAKPEWPLQPWDVQVR